MELLTFAMAANDVKVFAKAGRYIEVIDAAYPITLQLYETAGGQTDEARNALAGIFIEDQFAQFHVINSATAQTITLLVHDGRGGSRRQPGTVQVMDGGRIRTLANVAGMANSVVGASVGNFSYGQFWNPPGSGKRVFVKAVYAGSSIAGDIFIRSHNAALATLQGTPISKLNQNFIAGLELREGVNAALLGQSVLRFYCPANSTIAVRMEEPLCLDAGFGVMGTPGGTNRDIALMFEFYVE